MPRIVCGNVQILFKEPDQIQKKRTQKNHPISIYQTKLTDFLDDAISFFKRKIRLPYKTKPINVNEEYIKDKLPDDQKTAFKEYGNFHGYLGNLFTLNPSLDNYFMNLQLKSGNLDMNPNKTVIFLTQEKQNRFSHFK